MLHLENEARKDIIRSEIEAMANINASDVYVDHAPKSTLCFIGETGSGKSILSKAFLEGVVVPEEDQLFRRFDSARAPKELEGTLFGEEGSIKIFDLPGVVYESQVNEMTKYLKSDVGVVKSFCLVVNGHRDARFDRGTISLLKALDKDFGPVFWQHVCIVFTRWGQSAK